MSVTATRAALGTDGTQRFLALTWTLAVTEWRLRFYGSALGVAWTLVRPFAFFGVIYVVFVEIAGIGAQIPNYAQYLLLSLMLFGFFGEVTNGCVGALVYRGDLLRKIKVPYMIVPLSVTITALMNLGMALLAATAFLAVIGTYPSLAWLQLLPIVGLLTTFALGLGLLLSALYVRFRDVQPIWEVLVQMLYFASPILYVATMVPDAFLRPYMVNPIATLLSQMRHAIVDPLAPSAATMIGSSPRLIIPLGIIFAAFTLGMWVFRREAPRVAERV
jgi:ABC-2 type transport system permease protein